MLALFSNRSYVIHLLLVTVATLTLGLVSTIHAQETTYDASFSSNVKEAIPINVLVGQSRVINFDRPIGRFSISNPEIAEAVMVRPDQVLVNGKSFGQVNFIAWEKSDSKFIVFDVFVRRFSFRSASRKSRRTSCAISAPRTCTRAAPVPVALSVVVVQPHQVT